eukprot:COSAG04_NODE_417_length_14700_cov_114.213709_5_plen_212_part_00
MALAAPPPPPPRAPTPLATDRGEGWGVGGWLVEALPPRLGGHSRDRKPVGFALAERAAVEEDPVGGQLLAFGASSSVRPRRVPGCPGSCPGSRWCHSISATPATPSLAPPSSRFLSPRNVRRPGQHRAERALRHSRLRLGPVRPPPPSPPPTPTVATPLIRTDAGSPVTAMPPPSGSCCAMSSRRRTRPRRSPTCPTASAPACWSYTAGAG